MLSLSYYCLCLLFNKIGEILPGNEWGGEEREGEKSSGERWPKQCMHM
jgi:hypothetical protein